MAFPTLQLATGDEHALDTRVTALESADETLTASVASAAAAAAKQDICFQYIGKPGNGATMGLFVSTGSFVIPAALAGTKAKAVTPPADGALVLELKKNGAAASGTISLAQTTGVATLTAASPIALAMGDVLTLVNAATADGSAADFAVTVLASRTA